MLNLEDRVEVVEENIDRLESLFGHFIAQTGTLLKRMEKQAAADRKAWQEYMDQSDQRWEKRSAEWQEQLAQSKREWQEQLAESKQEWQKQLAESNQRWEQQTAEERRHWNKRWGELADKMGTIPEDIVAPNLPRIAKTYFGCEELEDFMVRRKVRNKKDPSKRREFDVIAVCSNQVIINETKSTPTIEYINGFIQALAEIEDYFPEYQSRMIIPIFASLYMGEDIVNYLTKKKIYAMAMGDETMELLNGRQFTLT